MADSSSAVPPGPHPRKFVPAAGLDWLLPLYDPLMKLLRADVARQRLVEQASVAPGDRVLDVGCGTGGLTLLLKRACPDAEVVGLDPDPGALERARAKAARAGLALGLDRGFADALPYPDGAFERVVSAFVLHHLSGEDKLRSLREARRVLAPKGELHVLDFGGPAHRHDGWLARAFHSHEHVADNFEGRLPELMREAGFEDAREVGHRSSWFGRMAYYAAVRP